MNYGERSDFMPKNDNKNGLSAFLSLFNGTKPMSGEAKRGLVCFIVLIFTQFVTIIILVGIPSFIINTGILIPTTKEVVLSVIYHPIKI